MKIKGIITGKFIKQITPTLAKFQGQGAMCYITTQFPVELDRPMSLFVRELGTLGGLKRYKHCGRAPYAMAHKVSKTARLKAVNELKSEDNTNEAFTGGKYKAMAFQFMPQKKVGKEKALLKKATQELTRVLREVPVNQRKVGLKEKTRRELKERSRPSPINLKNEKLINKAFEAHMALPKGKDSDLKRTKAKIKADKEALEIFEKENPNSVKSKLSNEIKDFFN